MRHDSFISLTWFIHMYDMIVPTCDMKKSYVWHNFFIRDCGASLRHFKGTSRCMMWLIPMCDMTHSYVTVGRVSGMLKAHTWDLKSLGAHLSSATHCTALQRTAPHCNALQHTVRRFSWCSFMYTLHVCVCVYICIHTYIDMYIYIYMYILIHLYVCTYISIHILYICLCTKIHIWLFVNM